MKKLLVVLILLFVAYNANADNILIYDTPLNVDKIEDLNSIQTKITLFKTSKIISKDKINSYVAEQYLSNAGLASFKPDVALHLLSNVAREDNEWLKKNQSSLQKFNHEEMKREIKEEFAVAIKNNNLEKENNLISVADIIFQNVSFASYLLTTKETISSIKDLLSKDINSASLYREILPLINIDPIISKIVFPKYVERIHFCAERSIKKDDIRNALEFLTLVDHDHCTQTTIRLINASLSKVRVDEFNEIFTDLLLLKLRVYAMYDMQIKTLLTNIIADHIQLLIDEKKTEGLPQELNILFSLRPDPNKENDILRKKLVLFFRSINKNDLITRCRLDNIKINNKFLSMTFLKDKHMLPILLVIVVILVVIIFLIYRSFKSNLRVGGRRSFSNEDDNDSHEDAKETLERFRRLDSKYQNM